MRSGLQDRPLRRQHARGCRHRRRQGRGGESVRLRDQRLRSGDLVVRHRRGCRDGEVDEAVRRVRQRSMRRRGVAPRRSNVANRCAMRRASSSACVRSSRSGGFAGLHDTFENLHGLNQLPGIAAQRLMADGLRLWRRRRLENGCARSADESDGRRTARRHVVHGGLHVPSVKGEEKVLGAHMLEVCPSIAAEKPSLRDPSARHRRKGRPVRLVFDAPPGPAINVAHRRLGIGFEWC